MTDIQEIIFSMDHRLKRLEEAQLKEGVQ